MRFKVIKSHMDGLSDTGPFDAIADVLREVRHHAGWDSVEQMHDSITKWAKAATPGSVFTTRVSAIVAVAVSPSDVEDDICHHCDHEGLDYADLDAVEGGGIEQEVTCPECGKRWQDVFVLADRHELA